MALLLVVGVIAAIVIVYGSKALGTRAASAEAIAEARSTTQILAQSVIGPEFPPGLVHLRPENLATNYGKLDTFDQEVQERLLNTDRPYRINIWSQDGRLIYSSQTELLLKDLDTLHLSIDSEQRAILENGGVGSEIADPSRPEDLAAAGTEGMVRIYTRFVTQPPSVDVGDDETAGAGKPVLFEAYFSINELSERRGEIFDSFRWITLGCLALLTAVATMILVGLTGQVRRGAAERERLLHSAMEASDAERRRIARDLHDSVVQDLAGTAFAVTAVARQPDTDPAARATLDEAGTALRGSLKALRSLLAEIHPPDLNAEGLAAALADLIASASVAGIQASVSVTGAETISNERAALVWRVAQEAVRNATRHSQASTLAVTVRGDGKSLVLEVVDDGIGFEPRGPRDAERYGLRGLRSLVVDSGGTLDVRSSPGDGTTVYMEVSAQ